MTRFALLLFTLFTLCAGTAVAAAGSQTIRPVELKSAPSADAASAATLPADTPVQVLQRKGAWYEVSSAQGNGWLRMLSVRGSAGAAAGGASQAKGKGKGNKSGGGFAGLRGLVTGGNPGKPAVATGVRGLSEEDLRNARPDRAELEKLLALAAEAGEARRFAAEAKLAPRQVDYLAAANEKDAAR